MRSPIHVERLYISFEPHPAMPHLAFDYRKKVIKSLNSAASKKQNGTFSLQKSKTICPILQKKLPNELCIGHALSQKNLTRIATNFCIHSEVNIFAAFNLPRILIKKTSRNPCLDELPHVLQSFCRT